MSHPSEERLLQHYYGEEEDAPEVRRHLEACPDCRALYGELQRTLNLVDSMAAPERDMDYGAQVWRRIEPLLPVQRYRGWLPVGRHWAAGLAFAGIMAAAFLASRSHPRSSPPALAAADPQAGERVLLLPDIYRRGSPDRALTTYRS
jgi:anti-sigma factor RsiW